MNEKIFKKLNQAANALAELSFQEYTFDDETFKKFGKTYEKTINEMARVLGDKYEWHFNSYNNGEIEITIYDCIELYITNEGVNIYNPFTEEYIPFNMKFESSLKKLIDDIRKLEESGKIKELDGYIVCAQNALDTYRKYKKIIEQELGKINIDKIEGHEIESVIVRKKLNLD